MRRVQYLAAQSSLPIRTFTPTAAVQKDFYQEVPIHSTSRAPTTTSAPSSTG